MGIDPAQIPEHMRKLSPELSGVLPRPRAQRFNFEFERDMQCQLAAWLKELEDGGRLVYDWSAMHRKITNRPGIPDFRIYKASRALLAEMKLPQAKLRPDQEAMHAKFLRSGTEVRVWRSVAQAKQEVIQWIWQNFAEWILEPEQEPTL